MAQRATSPNTILVVDDESDILALFGEVFAYEGYRVDTAISGEEGWRLFQAERPDLVITDLRMPGMGGLELIAKIRSVDSTTPVLVVSAVGSYREDFRLRAIDGFVDKPVDVGRLLSRIREFLTSG